MSSHIHIDALDRRNGNGSRTTEEDWLDQHTTAATNEWSSANTTFYYWEAPASKKRQFKNLYDRQHGKGDPNRSSELPRMKAVADTKAFCSMLELGDKLVEEVLHIMRNIEIGSKHFGGKSYEKIILAVCTLVHDRDLSSRPASEISYEQRLIFDETFRELMDANDLGSSELRGVREQIRSTTDYF